MQPAPTQVLCIASHNQHRSALRVFLARIPSVTLVDEAASESEAIQKLAEKPVDLVLLDLASYDLDGIALTRQIRKLHPRIRVLITTASDMACDIFAAMDAGADGYLLRGNLFKALESAINSVRLGAVWLDPAIAKQVLEAMETASTEGGATARILQTGCLPIPLFPKDHHLLNAVADSNCSDIVPLVDQAFVNKLKRFAPAAT